MVPRFRFCALDGLWILQIYDLVISRRFEYFMFFWIMMSCGQMMAERPSFARTSLAYQVRLTLKWQDMFTWLVGILA